MCLKDTCLDATLNGGFSLFRDLAWLCIDIENNACFRLNMSFLRNYLSLLSVSHTTRSDSLPVIARNIECDFGRHSGVFAKVTSLLSPDSLKHITSVRLLLVEGFMKPFRLDRLPNLQHLRI